MLRGRGSCVLLLLLGRVLKRVLQVPNAQLIVNAVQLQRNVALDNCATLSAELEETKEELKVAQAEIEHLHNQLEDMIKTQLPDTGRVPIA